MCDLNNLSIWPQATDYHFNFNKYVVFLCGANNPNFVHTVYGQIHSRYSCVLF